MGLVSKQCVDFVKRFEGFSATVYRDCVGVPTLGYGLTGSEIRGRTSITKAQASKELENLLNTRYAQPIKNDLDRRGIHLNQNQFDSLVSMAYNVGTSGVLGSTLYRNICNGVRDRTKITNDFCMWCKAGGRTVAGLLRRRKEEANMFFGGGNTSSGNSNITYGQGGSGGKSYYPVVEVQKMLEKIGYPCGGVDGDWGPGTLTAVKAFQRDCSLSIDGVVGNTTYHKIKSEYSKKLGIKTETKSVSKNKSNKEDFDMEDIVLYFGPMDANVALFISQKKKCPMMDRKQFEASNLKAKNKIYVGGKKGTDRFDSLKDAVKLL